ncbi:MAG: methyltransferase domain-containing protein [Lentisphaeria bacterium]
MTSTIQHSFGRAAGRYDSVPGVQPAVARRLAGWLPAAAARVLEVGCGTGNLTERLRPAFPQATCWITDLAPAMVAAARRRLEAAPGAAARPGAVHWQAGDIRAFMPPAGGFDLIASSSALHWIQPLEPALARLAGWLAPGGQLLAALILDDTLGELRASRQAVAPVQTAAGRTLPSEAAVRQAVAGAGLALRRAETETICTRADSAAALFRQLRAQGVAAGIYPAGAGLTRGGLARLAAHYDRHYPHPQGGVAVTWRVFYFSATTPFAANRDP